MKDLILFEDEQFRFLICKYEEKFVYFLKVKKNFLSSAWKFFDTELDAIRFAEDHIIKYQESGVA